MNTRIASPSSNNLRLLLHKRSLRLRERRLGLRRNSLRGTRNDLPALHKTLDHPVLVTATEHTGINTSLAQIKVTVITDTAVVMLIRDSLGAVVAVDGEDADC